MVKLPVCFESKSTATIFRKLLDELGYNYTRKNTNRSYTRVAIIIALERTALVHRYEIDQQKIIVDIWEEIPSSGKITYLEIRGGENNEQKMLLQKLRIFARQLGLKSCFTPVASPQSNGMSEAFVKTLKRDYVRVKPLPNAETVLNLIGEWIEDYNDNQSHSGPIWRSP